MYLIHDNSHFDNEFGEKLYYNLEEILEELPQNVEVLVEDANFSQEMKQDKESTFNKAIRREGKLENKYFSAYDEEGNEILPCSVKELVLAAHKNPRKNIEVDTGPVLNPNLYGKFIGQNKELVETIKENEHSKKNDLMFEIAEYINSIDELTKKYIDREFEDPENSVLIFGPMRNIENVLAEDYEVIEKNERTYDEISDRIRKLSAAMYQNNNK